MVSWVCLARLLTIDYHIYQRFWQWNGNKYVHLNVVYVNCKWKVVALCGFWVVGMVSDVFF